MIQNYIVVALRNVRRYATYSIINVFGLGLGMACALLIFTFVKYHLSFDNYHKDLDRVYRIVTEQQRDVISYTNSVPNPLGKALREDYDFAEKVGRVVTFDEQLITIEERGQAKKFNHEEVSYAESDYFDIITIPMVQGDIKALLNTPHAAVMTKDKAKKFFGDKNPIDQVIRIDNRIDFRVVGLMDNIPDNTDRRVEIYLSFEDLKSYDPAFVADDAWGGIYSAMKCYVRLKPGVNIPEMEEAMFGYVKKFRPNSKNVHHYKLQPISDIHFNPVYGGNMSKRNLWALGTIGFFLVITACVNFINLATAKATARSKEVGVRKVLGGMRYQLFWQFMSETVIITLVSVIFALTIATAVVPSFNQAFGARISINLLADGRLLLFVPVLVVFVSFISGLYPGLILSGFQPAVALKGKLNQIKAGGLNLRRSMIVTQFTISQILVIVLIVIVFQVRYSRDTNMGFSKDAIMIVPVGSGDERMKTLKSQLQALPGVEDVSLCFTPPASQSSWSTSVRYGNHEEVEPFLIKAKMADEDFLSTFGIELLTGRNLIRADSGREFLVNEEFVRKMNFASLDDVLGENIMVANEWTGQIVGVVKDFHDASFHSDIKPVFIGSDRKSYNYYGVKINPAQITSVMASVEKTWGDMYPELLYSYDFLDDEIAEFYQAEENMLLLVEVFSLVAIVVGCIGLFGLVSFMSAQRTKEIGIRKVLGGSVSHILWIFGKEFSLLVVLSFVIAAPVGWWLMDKWLQDFKYHMNIGPWVFAIAFGSTLMIAAFTVGYRSLRAALANPVNSLRSE